MEDQFSNNTLQNISYPETGMNIIFPPEFYTVFWIISSMFFPLSILAIYSLVKQDHGASIFVNNLLISDLVQLCSFGVALYAQRKSQLVFLCIYNISVGVSVGFMVCVSLERYKKAICLPSMCTVSDHYISILVMLELMIHVPMLYYRYLVIACPLWYRFRRNIKVSVGVCVVVWVLPLVTEALALFLSISVVLYEVIFSIYYLLPFPVLIFSVVGTFRALSAATSVSSEEKRRIVGVLIVVLLNYTLLFLPRIICLITLSHNHTFNVISLCLLFFNPLADLFLYVFMRKGAVDKLLASLCCCSMDTQQEQQQVITVNDESM